MRKVFDSISHLNLKKFPQQAESNNSDLIYLPLNNKIMIYDDVEKLNKVSEILFEDEILDFHIYSENILIIGRNNKKIIVFGKKGEKISE